MEEEERGRLPPSSDRDISMEPDRIRPRDGDQ
jgi:hypothetical protein